MPVDKSVAEKARIKPGTRIGLVNRVPGVVESLGLPEDIVFVEPGDAQLVLLFLSTRTELESLMPRAVMSLAPDASIMVFFRKGSKAAGLEINRDSVWEIAQAMDLRPLGLVSVDDSWSAFRLRRT